MKENDHLNLQIHEKQALDELKSIVNRHYPNAKFILFGSKTRDNFEEFSDIDLLILLN